MKQFLFIHVDGRRGEGDTCWAAIIAAMGRINAYRHANWSEPRWEHVGTDAYVRKTDMFAGADDELQGVLYEQRQ